MSDAATTSSARGAPTVRRLVTGTTVLAIASGAHKAAMFAMRARVGQLGGAEALGAVTGVLTVTWMVCALSHLGMPDHALVRAAVPDRDAEQHARARHTLFFATALAALAVSMALALPGAADPGLAGLLVLGAIAQHLSSVTLQTLRGWERPGLESLALGVAAVLLAASAWLANDARGVAASYAMQGVVFVGALGWGVAKIPSLRPAWPSVAGTLAEVRASLPIFVVGVTAFGLGSSDVMATSFALGDAAVGRMTCATMVVRTGFQVPWILGTLALARARAAGPARMRLVLGLVVVTVLLAAGAGGTALVTGELAARAFGVPLAQFEHALFWSAMLAPVTYVPVVLLPLGMALALARTVRATLAAALVTAIASLGLARFGVVGVQVGYALGHLVLAIGLLIALRRAPTETPA